MGPELTKEEMIAKKDEIKSTEVDCYGLSKTDMIGRESTSQITDFDSFLLQDAIQLALLSQEQIAQFKQASASRFNTETQLYSVTIGDGGTAYYDYATMFNRLTNQTYAGKVSKSSDLLRQFYRAIGSHLAQDVKSSIGTHEMTESLAKQERER